MRTFLKAQNKNRGFTLAEIVLALAVISFIAGFGIPIYQSYQTRNDLDIAAGTIAQSLRRAQTLAQGGSGDSSWGLYVQSDFIAIFRGGSYLTRNSDFDEVFTMPGVITPTGLHEVVFAKFSGEPNATGEIVLTSSANETRNITINTKGAVDF